MFSFLFILCVSFLQKSTVQTARTHQQKLANIPKSPPKKSPEILSKFSSNIAQETTEIQPV